MIYKIYLYSYLRLAMLIHFIFYKKEISWPTNLWQKHTKMDENNKEEKIPPYVCCVLTEETWTWFAAILFFVILLCVATLKYCRKYLSKPKFETKNLKLLRKTLIEDDGDALGKIKLTPVKVEEFVKYCNTRRKHIIIDTRKSKTKK